VVCARDYPSRVLGKRSPERLGASVDPMDLDVPISRVRGSKAFMTERTEVSFVAAMPKQYAAWI
jgi:hypothetical protein